MRAFNKDKHALLFIASVLLKKLTAD